MLLRIGYLLPLLILLAADIGLLIFILKNGAGLSEIGMLGLVLLVFCLLTALIIHSAYRYYTWIRDKKIQLNKK